MYLDFEREGGFGWDGEGSEPDWWTSQEIYPLGTHGTGFVYDADYQNNAVGDGITYYYAYEGPGGYDTSLLFYTTGTHNKVRINGIKWFGDNGRTPGLWRARELTITMKCPLYSYDETTVAFTDV